MLNPGPGPGLKPISPYEASSESLLACFSESHRLAIPALAAHPLLPVSKFHGTIQFLPIPLPQALPSNRLLDQNAAPALVCNNGTAHEQHPRCRWVENQCKGMRSRAHGTNANPIQSLARMEQYVAKGANMVVQAALLVQGTGKVVPICDSCKAHRLHKRPFG